jgi:hypothetical protein
MIDALCIGKFWYRDAANGRRRGLSADRCSQTRF